MVAVWSACSKFVIETSLSVFQRPFYQVDLG